MKKAVISIVIGFFLTVTMTGMAHSADLTQPIEFKPLLYNKADLVLSQNMPDQDLARKNALLSAKGNHCGYVCRSYTDCGDNDGYGPTEDACHYCVDRKCVP
jgi:phage-related protein